MPLALQGQLEALLSVVSLTAAKAKPAFSYHNYEETNDEVFTVPLLYDNRFQRGPLDPYGRPPRLGKLEDALKSPLKKSKSDSNVRFATGMDTSDESMDEENENLAVDGGDLELPGGIWEKDGIQLPKPNGEKKTENAEEEDDETGDVGAEYKMKMFNFHLPGDSYDSMDAASSVTKSNSDWDAYQQRVRGGGGKAKQRGVSRSSAIGSSNSDTRGSTRAGTRAGTRGGTRAGSTRGDPHDSSFQTSLSTGIESGILENGSSVMEADTTIDMSETIAESTVSNNTKKKKSRKIKSQATLRTRDFTAYVKGGFERPFVCAHCNQAFSRAYTLKVHEKTHETFKSYHMFKTQPQLFLDDAKHELVLENMKKYVSSISLPPLIQAELNTLANTS